jgi:hypothetical protein
MVILSCRWKSVRVWWMGSTRPHSISYCGLLESNAVHVLVSSNMMPNLCKTFCLKSTSVSQPWMMRKIARFRTDTRKLLKLLYSSYGWNVLHFITRYLVSNSDNSSWIWRNFYKCWWCLFWELTCCMCSGEEGLYLATWSPGRILCMPGHVWFVVFLYIARS